jgi:LysR family glycine cleavage system transcriptional activator
MRRLPPLSALRAFEAAARQESFKFAAAELGVTPTAISHQIRQLEEHLGLALFERQTRKVVLTEHGRALFPGTRSAFDVLAETVDQVKRKPARRVATLSATVAFTAKLIVPHAGTFRALNPGWDLRLHASDEAVDLHAGEADAAIRYGRGKYAGLTALPLLSDRFAPICSPYLDVRAPADLAKVSLIHFDWGEIATRLSVPTWRNWADRAKLSKQIDAESGITLNDEASAIDLAIAGHGVALLSLSLVAAELASGALVQPFGPVIEGLGYDLVYPIGAETRPAVSVLSHWVMTDLAKAIDKARQPRAAASA